MCVACFFLHLPRLHTLRRRRQRAPLHPIHTIPFTPPNSHHLIHSIPFTPPHSHHPIPSIVVKCGGGGSSCVRLWCSSCLVVCCAVLVNPCVCVTCLSCDTTPGRRSSLTSTTRATPSHSHHPIHTMSFTSSHSQTLFADVDNARHSIAREEIFGPVLCVVPFDEEDDAVAIANDTPYGLTSYVQVTHSHTRATKIVGQQKQRPK